MIVCDYWIYCETQELVQYRLCWMCRDVNGDEIWWNETMVVCYCWIHCETQELVEYCLCWMCRDVNR